MLHRTLRRIAPTLLVLGLLPAAADAAASPVERTSHLQVVVELIERGYRLPAQEQIADFRKAGYPDAAWHATFLAWFHADRFRILAPDQQERERLAATAAALGGELDAALRDGRLPADLIAKLSGGGKVLRLVNDLMRAVGPDLPPDRQSLTDEQRAAADATTQALIAAATSAWQDGLAKVQANAANEEEWQRIEDVKDPRFERLARGAVELRFEAVRTAWFACRALREVAERGRDFGLDEAAATAFLRGFAVANFTRLQEWDFLFGDFHPYLRTLSLDLAGQAARFQVAGAIADDVAADLRRILDLDIAKDYARAPAVAEELRTLQARSWGAYIAWCREMGRSVSPRWYADGIAAYAEFNERTRSDRHVRLDHADAERAAEVARVHLQAGRLLLARNPQDPAAAAAFAAVAAVRGNPLARRATAWLAACQGSGPAGGAWGAQPVRSEPIRALATAEAMRRQADASDDPARQRTALLAGAVALRNGVLGLDGADEAAPELWFRYGECLSRLGMRWQAAVVAQAGLRHIQARTQALQGRTPWRGADGAWTDSGRFISLLARNAVAYAANLQIGGRSAAAARLYDEAVALVGAVSPADRGRPSERTSITNVIHDGDYARVLEMIDDYVRRHPEAYYDAASLRVSAYTFWIGRLKDAAQRRPVAARARQACAEAAERGRAELPDERDPARRREIEQALRDGLGLEVAIALADGEHERVFALLGPEHWRSAPADPERAAQLLGQLSTALCRWYEARTAAPAARADAALLLAAWPRVQAVHAIWQGQRTVLTGQAERLARQGAQIAWVFDLIVNVQIPAMRRQGVAAAGLADIASAAGRAFADLVEPTVDETSRPELVVEVGNVLWELGEHTRACRLLRLSLARSDADPALAALRDTPRAVLQPLDALLRPRPELRARWEEVVDLLHDDPQLHDQIRGGLPEAEWGERKRDYLAAGAAISALRGEVARARLLLGADAARIEEGLGRLDGQVRQLDQTVVVMSRLAQGLREQGDTAGASPLYARLLAYDPTDLACIAASVELTLERCRREPAAIPVDELRATRERAARARDAASACSPDYWTAAIQVHELSIVLTEATRVDERLRFDAVAGSTPAEDLQLRPRQPLDDARVRRARDAQAVALGRRYLALFAQPGVSAKPGFAIAEVAVDGRPVAVFVPADGLRFAAVSRRLADGSTATGIVAADAPPAP